MTALGGEEASEMRILATAEPKAMGGGHWVKGRERPCRAEGTGEARASIRRIV